MGKQHTPDKRQIAQHRQIKPRGRRRLDPDIALSDQRREAKAKERQREAACHLIGKGKLGQQREEKRQNSAPGGGGHKPHDWRAGIDSHGKAADCAGDHHPLDPEVEHARPLDNQFAQCRQQNGRRGDDERGQKQRRINRGQKHHATSRVTNRTR